MQAESSPLPVLLWHWGRRGGGPRYTFELARALAHRSDFEVHLSLSRQSEIFAEFAALGLPGFHVDTYHGKLSALLATPRIVSLRRRLARYVRENRIQVVHCTMSHLWNLAVIPGLRATGAKYVLTLHEAVPHPGEGYGVRRWMLAHEAALANGIVTLSEHVRGQVVELHGYPPERCWVAPHGVFPYASSEKPRSYPSARPLRLLFFGRLRPYKGLDLLLSAFTELRSQFPGIELTIAGSGRLASSRLDGIEGVRVDNRWIPEEEVGEFFAAADLVVLPYTEASQSGVIPTAYASGLPVVATPVGGLPEQVKQGETGLLATETTAEAIAAAIAKLIRDPRLYERCSAGALRYAKEGLSWCVIAERICEVVRTVAHAPEPPAHSRPTDHR